MEYAKLVEHWVDFYLSTPEETEECWQELRIIIDRAEKVMNSKSRTLYSAKEQEESKALLNKQIKRLPLKLRLQLEAPKTKKKAKCIVARVLPKPIKKKIKKIIDNTRKQQ